MLPEKISPITTTDKGGDWPTKRPIAGGDQSVRVVKLARFCRASKAIALGIARLSSEDMDSQYA